MVKVGPKIPTPSRRELEKAEKQQKRLVQLQSGIDPAMVGEPREHLVHLLATSKRTRVKHPDSLSIEDSKRKREKTQKRALARRAAKQMMKEIIARVKSGSKAHEGDDHDDFHTGADDDHGLAVFIDPATPSAAYIQPLTTTETAALPAFSQETGTQAAVHIPSEIRLSVSRLSCACSLEISQTLAVDNHRATRSPAPDIKPLVPSQPNESSSPDTSVISASRLQIHVSTETDTFCDNGTHTSATTPLDATKLQIAEDIKATRMSPKRLNRQEVLASQILLSSFGGSQRRGLAPGSVSQAPPSSYRPAPTSKIFSEPLEYSKSSSKSCLGSSFWPSASEHSDTPVYQKQRRGEPRLNGIDRPGTPIPEGYVGLCPPSSCSRLPTPYSVSLNSGEPSYPVALMDEFDHGQPVRDALTKTPRTSEEPCYAALSANDMALISSCAVPAWSTLSTQVNTPRTAEGISNYHRNHNSPVDSILLAIRDNKYPDIARLGGRLAVTSGADHRGSNSEESLSPARPSRSGQTPIKAQLIIPSHNNCKAYHNEFGQTLATSASFSSNMSSPRHIDSNSPMISAPITALKGDAPHHMAAYVHRSTSTIRRLAPAATILVQDKKVCSGALTERNLNIPRAATLDHIEKVTANSRTTSAVTDRIALSGQPKAFGQDEGYLEDVAISAPPPGAVSPASTLVPSCRDIFKSMELPLSRAAELPTHGPHVVQRRMPGRVKGFMLALKRALKRTFQFRLAGSEVGV